MLARLTMTLHSSAMILCSISGVASGIISTAVRSVSSCSSFSDRTAPLLWEGTGLSSFRCVLSVFLMKRQDGLAP